ncbi:MAG: DEAD/DEAH box helicase [Planctomycetota bacterium]
MHFKGYTLNAFQVQAARAIGAGSNVLLSAPTGAGKTLVAEYAIAQAVEDRRRTIYTSPIKALSNQKYRDFREEGLDVGLMTGDLTLNPSAPVVIMTTEIFRNAVFEDPERFDDVDFAIFDEIHFLDDPERGTVWEESLIFAPPHVRFIGLSATIANLHQFGKWIRSLREHELEIVHSERRPVPLHHKLFHPAVGVFDLSQRKKALRTVAQESQRHEQRHGGARGRRRDGRREAPRRTRRGEGRLERSPFRAAPMLLDRLQREELLPVLFFCFSRKECEIKADRNRHRRLLQPEERRKVASLFAEICRKFELDADDDAGLRGIHDRALRGVGYHHAGMLPIHKEVVERLFTSGLLKLLFTTETFALGINMPARTVVFDSLKKFDGVAFDYMRSRDYMQMAGRAGRQGMDAEGLVICVMEDEDLSDAPLAALFGGKVEPITSRFNLSYSTILNLYERLGMDLLDAYDRSFAAFQAQTGSTRNRERKRAQARAALRARIAVLQAASYLDQDGLLPRGRIAQQINGYEVQVTELLFQGILDDLDIHQLGAAFASLVHAERRGEDSSGIGRATLGEHAPRIEQAVRRFVAVELMHGTTETIKEPAFGIAPVVDAWSRGAPIEAIQRITGNDGGDAVRTMRMAIQMMRQLRSILSEGYGLMDRLAEAVVAINRDVVDAKRQFELG